MHDRNIPARKKWPWHTESGGGGGGGGGGEKKWPWHTESEGREEVAMAHREWGERRSGHGTQRVGGEKKWPWHTESGGREEVAMAHREWGGERRSGHGTQRVGGRGGRGKEGGRALQLLWHRAAGPDQTVQRILYKPVEGNIQRITNIIYLQYTEDY